MEKVGGCFAKWLIEYGAVEKKISDCRVALTIKVQSSTRGRNWRWFFHHCVLNSGVVEDSVAAVTGNNLLVSFDIVEKLWS